MEVIEIKGNVMDKVYKLDNMNYMCANCAYETTLNVNDLLVNILDTEVQAIKTCPKCGEERIYRFAINSSERKNLMDIATAVKQRKRK